MLNCRFFFSPSLYICIHFFFFFFTLVFVLALTQSEQYEGQYVFFNLRDHKSKTTMSCAASAYENGLLGEQIIAVYCCHRRQYESAR